MERAQLEHTNTYLMVHDSDICYGEFCTIHNRSNHNMRHLPQSWRGDAGFMERICEHGVGHPDPDEIVVRPGHGCDGCCWDDRVNEPFVGQLRGIRIQPLTMAEQDELGLPFAYPLVPEEGEPAVWNGSEWVQLIKGENK